MLLDQVGLIDRAGSYPDLLSGGEQQRVAIARAVAHGPSLVLADEPTGNLDDKTADEVLKMLDNMVSDAGGTMIVATHSARVAQSCDRVLDLHHGRLAPTLPICGDIPGSSYSQFSASASASQSSSPSISPPKHGSNRFFSHARIGPNYIGKQLRFAPRYRIPPNVSALSAAKVGMFKIRSQLQPCHASCAGPSDSPTPRGSFPWDIPGRFAEQFPQTPVRHK